jgi:ABC-type amino acid transport substrate-binding protein
MKRATFVALVAIAMLLVLAVPAFGLTAPRSYLLTISTYWDKDSDGMRDANEAVLSGEKCVLRVNGTNRYVTTDKCGIAKVWIPAGATVVGRPTLNPLVGCPNPYYVTEATPRLSGSNPPIAKVVMKGNRCMRFGLGAHRGRILVGTSADLPPFEEKVDGQIVGFDIDLVNEIAERLGYEVVYKDMPFSDIIPSLQTRKLNMAAAALTITDARKLLIDFSDPYYTVLGTIEQYGFGFPKCSPLRVKVNGALAEMMLDGTYQEIYDRWFGEAKTPAFWVGLDFNGIGGEGWPAGAAVAITADDPETATNPDIAFSLNADETGAIHGDQVFPGLAPGWFITVTDGVTTKTHTVRRIAITSVDPTTDVVRGTADPLSEVRVSEDYDAAERWVVADGSGNWSADFSGAYDIVPGSVMRALRIDEDGDHTFVDWEVPAP